MKYNNSNKVYGYSNAHWVERFDRKSIIGFCTFVGENLATWKNKKKNIVSRSSTEPEYRVMTSTIKQLLADIAIEIETPIKIFCDN
jgi:hypothetical protein